MAVSIDLVLIPDYDDRWIWEIWISCFRKISKRVSYNWRNRECCGSLKVAEEADLVLRLEKIALMMWYLWLIQRLNRSKIRKSQIHVTLKRYILIAESTFIFIHNHKKTVTMTNTLHKFSQANNISIDFLVQLLFNIS